MSKSELVSRIILPSFLFSLTTLKKKDMKKIIVMVCVYALLIAAGVGMLGLLGCGITDLFVEVPRMYYAFFGLLILIPLLLGYAYEGITYLISKGK